MTTVKTLSKGQIVIPAEIRKRHNIEQGTEIHVMEYGGIIYLIPPVEDPIKEACGILAVAPSLSKKVLDERKQDFR
ncbi:MAG: AbrB/MazE/SpoVT family DNA-binding domain-containing protein [Thermodesulfobacteriota bacterium]